MRFSAVPGAAIAGILCAQNLTPVFEKSFPLRSGTITIPKLSPGAQYSLLYSIESLRDRQWRCVGYHGSTMRKS